jgi:Mn2+/Fe2+ NRAMP family transporter
MADLSMDASPLLVVILLLASRKSVMGAFTASRPIIVIGWITTVVMGVAAVWMFILPGLATVERVGLGI